MSFGVSIYLNDKFTLDNNMRYVKLAKENGIERVFTSFNLPEINYEEKLKEIKDLIEYIKSLNMQITVDISPKTLNIIGSTYDNLSEFNKYGFSCLRLDYGFTPDEIAIMTKNEYGIAIELNASTIKKEFIEDLINKGADINDLRTCHNFYPKPYTGLSYSFFENQTKMIKEYGLRVAAFIPSQKGKRGPIFEGLPTIEDHRYKRPDIAAKYFVYSGLIDDIYFGDAYASDDEIKSVTSINKKVIELDIVINGDLSDLERNIIFNTTHTNRPDASEYLIRSEESRICFKDTSEIQAHDCIERKKYSVTIDNNSFKRYSGELNICKLDMPKDNRVNVVGYIPYDEHILVDLIKPGTKFCFKE
ncbi:cell surface protein [Thermoanaerobacterium thermosaccharolyticum]|uniref:Cell surface protein n=1 Tax=Thermoanaerobacterium thermosaccharolyticum TaxID=1517 RepID=A0A223HX02_THETR|nr:MupG family TIM beta-alpha barrel fold protein [Thermoanaerobacterium thermosaccharolyticum]AST57006.1 cell surface protein [Thermoanaerobacterium thermosaccharolyticum]